MFVNDIEQLGFTEKESRLYLTSLRIGPASMQVLARKAGIDRGTAYHVAKTLGQKGLFSSTSEEGARPQFHAAHPKALHEYLAAKKREADAHFSAIEEVYADLEDLYSVGA